MTQTANNTIDKQRIAKNTLLLYVRMFFLLLVGFYTVRLLLESLGVKDYGLYNVIFGLVTAFSFFSGAMSTTVQRFICHELGNGAEENARKVFSISLFLYGTLSVLIFILAETAGLWFVCNKMNIPEGRYATAQAVYQISIFMTIFKIMQIPYTAVITSYENMRTYAQISILDAFLHIMSVLSLKYILYDRLISVAALYTICNLVILLIYYSYCRKNYAICRNNITLDRQYLKSMSAFFSWNLFGATANMAKQQGLNLLLNVFCGVVLNATWGVATQVGNAINQFVASFQQAFNPQILKSYSNPDKRGFYELLQSCSKYSFLLIWVVALPLLLQTEFFLTLWLGNDLPEGAVIFTQLIIIYMIFDAICGPLWIAVQATGNIKRYQVEISCLIGSTFVFSLLALKLGAPAYSVALINTIINGSTLLYRLFYLRKMIQFPVYSYCVNTLLPIILAGGSSLLAGILMASMSGPHWYTRALYLCIISIINLLVIFSLALKSSEKKSLKSYLKTKLLHE